VTRRLAITPQQAHRLLRSGDALVTTLWFRGALLEISTQQVVSAISLQAARPPFGAPAEHKCRAGDWARAAIARAAQGWRSLSVRPRRARRPPPGGGRGGPVAVVPGDRRNRAPAYIGLPSPFARWLSVTSSPRPMRRSTRTARGRLAGAAPQAATAVITWACTTAADLRELIAGGPGRETRL